MNYVYSVLNLVVGCFVNNASRRDVMHVKTNVNVVNKHIAPVQEHVMKHAKTLKINIKLNVIEKDVLTRVFIYPQNLDFRFGAKLRTDRFPASRKI